MERSISCRDFMRCAAAPSVAVGRLAAFQAELGGDLGIELDWPEDVGTTR